MLNPLEAINEEISLAGKYAQEDAAQAVAEARFIREENGYYEQSIQEKLDNGLLEDFPDDQTPEYPEPEGEPSYQLPADVAKSKPRYGLGVVQFGNDLDRAAYIIRSKSKKSKGKTGSSPALRSKASTLRLCGSTARKSRRQSATKCWT